jgi:hypothetical protein
VALFVQLAIDLRPEQPAGIGIEKAVPELAERHVEE